MIYLASPYSDPNPAVMQQRFDAVCRYAGHLMLQGKVVYSPIAHCHPIAERVNLPRTWDFWEKFDRGMLKRADELVVLKLPGWDTSKGVAAETSIAHDLDLHISYVDPR